MFWKKKRKKNVPALYRHGDVLVQAASLPTGLTKVPGLVLAHGERTGHAHRIAESDGRAELLRGADGLYLQVFAWSATLVHEEHGAIALQPGTYRVWKQREYLPGGTGGEVRFVPVVD